MTSMFDRLRAADVTSDVPRWTPEEGDELLGILVRIDERAGRDDKPYRVATLRQEDDSLIAVSLTKMIEDKFDEHHAKPGDGIRLTFHGMKKSRGGFTFKDYGVVVIRATVQEVTW